MTQACDVSDPRARLPAGHAVILYEREAELLDVAVPLLRDALTEGRPAVVIATEEHRVLLVEALGDAAATALESGRLQLLDAAGTLAELLVDGMPDGGRFDAVVGATVRAAASGGTVAAFGEMVDLLASLGNVRAAIALEGLWKELQAEVPLSLVCAYSAPRLRAWASASEVREVCRRHTELHAGLPTLERPDVAMRFDAATDAPRDARVFVGEALQGSGLEPLADTAKFVVTELATNAIRHARTGFTVSMRADEAAGRVTLAVGDGSPSTPQPRDHQRLEPGGRGLQLIDALAGRWGHAEDRGGKLVWAELDGSSGGG